MFTAVLNRFIAIDCMICQKVAVLTGRRIFNRFMVVISKSGDGPVYFLLPVVIYFISPDVWIPFTIAGVVAFTFELTVQKIVKHSIKRQRPAKTVPGVIFLLEPPDQFSFPSGHTAGAFIIAALLVHFSLAATAAAFTWAVLVGFSRIYNGVHYPSDIITGAVLGLLSVKGTLFFLF